MPNLYIIAGCNGAGKTTAARTILPEMLNCGEFVNAGSIAVGLMASNPKDAAIAAGRIALNRIEFLLNAGADFAIETTLSGKCYASLVKKAQSAGYKVSLIFMWLNTSQLAIKRVANRVNNGGHNIPDDVIKRRFERGRYNLHSIYIPICDFYTIITTDAGKPDQVKTREAGQATKAVDGSGLLVDSQAKLTPGNIALRDKILKGATEAYKKLLTATIEKNGTLVVSDTDGRVKYVPAIELLRKLSETASY